MKIYLVSTFIYQKSIYIEIKNEISNFTVAYVD